MCWNAGKLHEERPNNGHNIDAWIWNKWQTQSWTVQLTLRATDFENENDLVVQE
jgi:hypothetical protein